jgi:hypothetical protein
MVKSLYEMAISWGLMVFNMCHISRGPFREVLRLRNRTIFVQY